MKEQQFPNQQYEQEGIETIASMGRPIPGQSLTQNPNEVRPFEGAPEFTNFREALDYTVSNLLEQEVIEPIIKSISSGTPIMDVVMQISYVGFREGKWNPDLMMMLIEPLAYVVMALCEKAGINFTIYREEEEDEAADDNDYESSQLEKLADLSKEQIGSITNIPQGAIPKEIEAKIESLDLPSLLSRDESAPIEAEPESLLSRG
jgi:hypothetical protein